MTSEVKGKESIFRTIFNMMLSPGSALKGAISHIPYYFSAIISAAAFGLFFLQTGIDLYRTGQQPLLFTIVITLIGIAFGLIVVPFLASIVWIVSKPFGNTKTLEWTISAFCMSYSGALIYCVFGLIVAITLGWRTSIAFGVTGVLWAIGPMIATIRQMLSGKVIVSVFLAAGTGAVVLFCWSFIGKY